MRAYTHHTAVFPQRCVSDARVNLIACRVAFEAYMFFGACRLFSRRFSPRCRSGLYLREDFRNSSTAGFPPLSCPRESLLPLACIEARAQDIGKMSRRFLGLPSLSALAQLPRVTPGNIADLPGAKRIGNTALMRYSFADRGRQHMDDRFLSDLRLYPILKI